LCYNYTELLGNYSIQQYFNDPVLTFEDQFIYGCSVRLNYEELKTYCESNAFANLMLFKNIENLNYLGRYGNSDPHFISDWIEVTTESTKDKSTNTQGEWTV